MMRETGGGAAGNTLKTGRGAGWRERGREVDGVAVAFC